MKDIAEIKDRIIQLLFAERIEQYPHEKEKLMIEVETLEWVLS